MNKPLFYIIVMFLLSSCTITGPYTGAEYSIGANTEDGIYIKIMPLRWKQTVETAKALSDWATDYDKE